jgi:hypothetical protein
MLLAIPALSLVEGVSRADEPEPALALFQQGRELSARGDYAGACAKFAASLALRPKLGTRLNLGDCAEHLGRTATARTQFLEAAAMARQDGDAARAEYAVNRADALTARIPHIVLRGFPASHDARLRIDGVDTPTDGGQVDLSLDPGDHELSIDAPARRIWSRKVHLDEGAQPLVLDVPSAPEAPVDSTRQGSPVASDAPASAPKGTPSQRIAALAAVGVGVVGLGIGTYYGLEASSQWSDAKKNCPHLPLCNSTGVQQTSDANHSALGSTVSFGIGLAAVAAGATLWWTAPSTDHASAARPPLATPVVGSHEAGLLLQGVF